MIDVNLGPARWLSKAVAPHMQRQGSGAIVHVPPARGSSHPRHGGLRREQRRSRRLDPCPRYRPAPARDASERGCAAAARHPANRAIFPAEALAHAVEPQPIAGVIAFLVSDAAAPVSGAILPAYCA
jgi:NAD(P)-dependent dehydrogenase (short-subunit alcohol dehydrogenase family)